MLKLIANPTFTAKVDVPAPGGNVSFKVEFKHMTKEAYDAFAKAEKANPRTDPDVIMDVAVGWSDVDAPFNRENVAIFCQQYHAAARAIADVYVSELTQVKLGN